MTADLTPTEHRDRMLDVFSEITVDCQRLGLSPRRVAVLANYSGGYGVDLQFHRAEKPWDDVPAVDALADAYGLDPDDGKTSNYTRSGRMDVDGLAVTVTVFTGRPKPQHDPERCVLPASHVDAPRPSACLPAPAGRIAVETSA